MIIRELKKALDRDSEYLIMAETILEIRSLLETTEDLIKKMSKDELYERLVNIFLAIESIECLEILE